MNQNKLDAPGPLAQAGWTGRLDDEQIETQFGDGEEKSPSALDTQIGGSHYKEYAIQPVDFIHKNGIGYLEGNVIKYVCRHHKKGGKQDLLKALHYLQILLELEYPGS